jgi:3-oxoacyl-[acyl-carrier protein] reductase
MDLALKGKYALVTGASYGIGQAIALALAGEGCNVAICARQQDKLKKTVSEIEALGVKSIGIPADVLIPSDVNRVIEQIIKAWGTIHILVNNVGGGGGQAKSPVEETPEEVWLEVYRKNALAAVHFTTKTIPFMRKQSWGRVVTITSLQGREGGGRPWYNMAKSAEISLMKTLAMDPELSSSGITFNSVAPGAVIFPGNEWDQFCRQDPEKFQARVKAKNPCGRLGTPEDIASAVVFLCSEKASLINGTSIAVDGAEGRSF